VSWHLLVFISGEHFSIQIPSNLVTLLISSHHRFDGSIVMLWCGMLLLIHTVFPYKTVRCHNSGAALLVEAANMGDPDAQYELGCRLRVEVRNLYLVAA